MTEEDDAPTTDSTGTPREALIDEATYLAQELGAAALKLDPKKRHAYQLIYAAPYPAFAGPTGSSAWMALALSIAQYRRATKQKSTRTTAWFLETCSHDSRSGYFVDESGTLYISAHKKDGTQVVRAEALTHERLYALSAKSLCSLVVCLRRYHDEQEHLEVSDIQT